MSKASELLDKVREGKFIKSESIARGIKFKGSIKIPVSGVIKYIDKDIFDKGESLNMKLEYDADVIKKAVLEEMKKILVKVLPKEVDRSIFKISGGSELISFPNSFVDKYL